MQSLLKFKRCICRNRTKNLQIGMETQKTLNGQTNLEKEEQSWRPHTPDFKLHCKALVVWTVWYWHDTRHKDQQNRTESPEINPHICGQLICDKGGKNIQWGRHSLFSKWCWENWTSSHKIMRLDQYLTSCTKTNSKWIRYLNIKPGTIKLLEGNRGDKVLDFIHGDDVLDFTPKAKATKVKVSK